ncbi:cell division protein ZapA [Parvimonas micra]|uniref:cell division protein ZapA n=1 Tax=Parvimonas micra TaxID=33033 RepID=UPI0020064499|nr:cell division protein ZapA [Parvimonas micra]MCK6129912.1 cell division protein ZapA [Parvimonas micra]MCK6135558.1 cell division protein ZapA [Parvimonas micra]MCK6137030.1 cell division protein ZapA [Parvimonas micra]MCK6153557.1 cell division protein ZapA [Parvimonas micra]
MNNKIKVNIAGSVYTIIGEKSKDEVEAIANFVDEEIKKITSQNYLLNSTMAATLVALNVSSDNFDLRKEINLLSEDSEFPIKKQEEFLKNNQKIEKEKEELKQTVKELTDKNNVLVHTIGTLEKRYENLEKISYDNFYELKQKNEKIIELQNEIVKIKNEYINRIIRFGEK